MLDRNTIDSLWDQGYRPFEIYVCNSTPVEYCGKIQPAGAVKGWEIHLVVAKRDTLEAYPFFDCVIGGTDMACADVLWQDGSARPI